MKSIALLALLPALLLPSLRSGARAQEGAAASARALDVTDLPGLGRLQLSTSAEGALVLEL